MFGFNVVLSQISDFSSTFGTLPNGTLGFVCLFVFLILGSSCCCCCWIGSIYIKTCENSWDYYSCF